MVVPTAASLQQKRALERFQSAETGKAVAFPGSSTSAGPAAVNSAPEVPQYVQIGADEPPRTPKAGEGEDNQLWSYFFGPTGEETRQQLEQMKASRYAPHEELREVDAAAPPQAPTTRQQQQLLLQQKQQQQLLLRQQQQQQSSSQQQQRMSQQQQQPDEDDELLPGWLSWLDPSGGKACAGGGPRQQQQPQTPDTVLPDSAVNAAYGEDGGSTSSQSARPAAATATTTSSKDQAAAPVLKELGALTETVSEEDRARRRLVDPPADVDGASIDSSLEESKLFRDLDSLPSAREATVGGAADFDVDGNSTAASISNSVVENKLDHFKMPRQQQQQGDGNGNAQPVLSKEDAAKSLEARRQILVKELRSTIATFGRYDVKTANISAALGDLLDESEQYDQAMKLHRDAVEIYSSKLGDDHSTTMEAKLQLGKVLENAGKFDEAINIYFLVTVMRRAIHGEKDPSAADSLVLMANALRKKDDYHQAIKELKRALKIYREALGDAHNKVSSTVDEIASLYVTIGDFEKSAAILEEVVKLKAVTQGMQSRAVAVTLCSLATTYECSEDFAKAMKSLKKAYKIYTEMDGYSSKEATNTLNRIAQLYEATGDNDRASIAYLGVLRGRKINHGDDHLLVAETYYKLGHSLRESGQHDKALKCLKEGLPIFVNKGVEINDVEMIAEVMHEMALINKERKRFNEAARIFKQELGVRRKIGQADYPMIARTLNHLGVTEYEMKNNNKSLKYLIEALTIFKDRAEGSVECAEVLFNTGLVFESSRNRERAMEAYDEAARIFREHGYKENHPHLAKATRKIEKLQQHQKGGGVGLVQRL